VPSVVLADRRNPDDHNQAHRSVTYDTKSPAWRSFDRDARWWFEKQGGVTVKEIAERTNMSRQTIGRACKNIDRFLADLPDLILLGCRPLVPNAEAKNLGGHADPCPNCRGQIKDRDQEKNGLLAYCPSCHSAGPTWDRYCDMVNPLPLSTPEVDQAQEQMTIPEKARRFLWNCQVTNWQLSPLADEDPRLPSDARIIRDWMRDKNIVPNLDEWQPRQLRAA
jgi:hypothetical protein